MFAPSWTLRQLLASDPQAMLAFTLESVGLLAGVVAVWLGGEAASLWLLLSELSVDVQTWGCDDGTAGGCGIVILIILFFYGAGLAVLWAFLATGLTGLWLAGRCLRAPWPVLALMVAAALVGLSTLVNFSTAKIAQDALVGALFVAGVQVFWGGGAALLALPVARKLLR